MKWSYFFSKTLSQPWELYFSKKVLLKRPREKVMDTTKCKTSKIDLIS